MDYTDPKLKEIPPIAPEILIKEIERLSKENIALMILIPFIGVIGGIMGYILGLAHI